MKIFWIFLVAVVLLVIGVLYRDKLPVPEMVQEVVDGDILSDGVISFARPTQFGLAVTQEQLAGMVQAYIPPCSEGFQYCFYYNDNEFEGSNFESAGVAIRKRSDLNTERLCLDMSPEGYPNMGASTLSTNTYSASIFSPIGDAGAGHYSNGEIYRLYVREPVNCYEIETRIGETQFANYPAGTVRQFVEADRDKVYAGFRKLLDSLKLVATGGSVRLPDSEN